jgi:protein-S-isoprenylcysteine O-methyltransferase Ste14
MRIVALSSWPLVVGYVIWVSFVILWNVTERRSSRTIATAGPRRERLFELVLTAGLVLIVLAPMKRVSPQLWNNPVLLEWAMLLVVVAGIAFCCWARFHLGRLWSPRVLRKEKHRVVDTGPYRMVRHPIYTGFIVIYMGLGALCANGLALAAVALLTLGLWLKARVEEHFLLEELGAEAYSDYKARTPMLVPRVPH